MMLALYAAVVLCVHARVAMDKKPNIVFVLTDDQDLRLGSMQAMPYLRETVLPQAANLSNFFIHTPICCPSRATLLSGRYVHNNKVSSVQDGGCMRMNTSRADNREFWYKSFVRKLSEGGYKTGVFGKLLNTMTTYGCDNKSYPEGLDRGMIMCGAVFYGANWADYTRLPDGSVNGTVYKSGKNPEDYTTSVIGNKTIEWMRSIIESGPDHPPFFAYMGPHAPHLPSTPPPYQVDPELAKIPVPTLDPYYGFLGADKHSFLATEPIINADDFAAIQDEHTKRLQSLVAVDDIVRGVAEYLTQAGEWDNTYFFYTSDHGYSLGQFRVDSHKTQVYDHNTRVPMIIRGPGVVAGEMPAIASMADLAPTIVDLALGVRDEYMDGDSMAALLKGESVAWKDTALVEYMSIRNKNVASMCNLEEDEVAAYKDAYGFHEEGPRVCSGKPNQHIHDGPNNTFSAMRVINGSRSLMFAFFVDVTNPLAWDFAPDQINFRELYDVTNDYYMMENLYPQASDELKKALNERLFAIIKCNGRQDCVGLLSGNAITLPPLPKNRVSH